MPTYPVSREKGHFFFIAVTLRYHTPIRHYGERYA